MGYRYRLHVKSLPGTPDMVFPRLRKVIEIRGCFWHWHSCRRCRVPATRRAYWAAKMQRNRARDRKTVRGLRALGWEVLVVWECQLSDRRRVLGRLARFLHRPPLPTRATPT